ncbi:MAG: patatin-like phospholipase family protein, partial [Dysgonamonadaceae bacterium]|nr:patatin-like phospholipase family protein [Dysgonamonadaceae bacterium]
MFKRVFLINLIILFGMFSAYSQKVGLVLSGGGAKGAVHIGVIKALEDNCIPIDYIAGTSIGAIVGSLYAMGYSPEEMLTLFLSEEFNHWQTGKVEEGYQYYFRKKREKPDFISLNIPIKDSLKIRNAILPNSLTNPIQINQAFLHIFSQANAQCNGDFDQLFVPFLCIASDVYNKKAIVFRNGNLGDAVRASMTFPFVFKPILKDSIPLFDGGIYDNFPVEPMKNAWNPDFVIGSSVAGNKKIKPAEQSIYEQMESIVMQKSNYDIGANEGIILKFIPEDVGLLDFHKAEQLYKTGYNTTLAAIDSIKKCIHRRTCLAEVEAKRTAYKASLPNLIFKNIHISGVTKMQKIYIESQIQRDNNNAFTIEDFKRTYFHLLTNPKIKEILPHARYDAENKTFDLFLDIQMSDEITIAFGGNISSMSANQIYLGVGYRSMSKVSSTYSLDMQLGNAYNGVALEGKVEIPNKIPLDISGLLAYNHQQYYESSKLFIDTDVSTF